MEQAGKEPAKTEEELAKSQILSAVKEAVIELPVSKAKVTVRAISLWELGDCAKVASGSMSKFSVLVAQKSLGSPKLTLSELQSPRVAAADISEIATKALELGGHTPAGREEARDFLARVSDRRSGRFATILDSL